MPDPNIRLIEENDATLLSKYYLSNETRFKPWSPVFPADHNTLANWQKRIKELLALQSNGAAAYFIALDNDQRSIIAHCNLSQIFYGPFKACYMGYAIDGNFEGKGIMYETCLQAIDYAFNTLELHRIMANYMPHNNRSAVLLNRLGFVKEGLARDYLKINGKWENHMLTSLTNRSNRNI